jgi:hypothetical protein
MYWFVTAHSFPAYSRSDRSRSSPVLMMPTTFETAVPIASTVLFKHLRQGIVSHITVVQSGGGLHMEPSHEMARHCQQHLSMVVCNEKKFTLKARRLLFSVPFVRQAASQRLRVFHLRFG